jgi:uncharacterized MnhB-related membrane protein
MFYAVLVVGAISFAVQAMRSRRLLENALFLAGVSAFISIMLYALGALQVAVIELSVGAGLVTVLLVYAIGVAGEATRDMPSLIPKPLAWGLIVLAVVLLGYLVWSMHSAAPTVEESSFTIVLWQERALDVWVQIALVFSGVLGILGLLAEEKPSAKGRIELPPLSAQPPPPQMPPEEVHS